MLGAPCSSASSSRYDPMQYIKPVSNLYFPQPCAFLATDYMLLARLASTFDTQVSERCLLIRASRLAKLFVCSDVITFLLQAAGGGLMSSGSMASMGNKVRRSFSLRSIHLTHSGGPDYNAGSVSPACLLRHLHRGPDVVWFPAVSINLGCTYGYPKN
jgi:hypothetical protein